jgi:hypothetical protein
MGVLSGNMLITFWHDDLSHVNNFPAQNFVFSQNIRIGHSNFTLNSLQAAVGYVSLPLMGN